MKDRERFQNSADRGVTWLMSGLAVLSLASCTKQRPLKEVFKDTVVAKALIDTSSDYLYVPSSAENPRGTTASRPFWQATAKLGRFEFGEDGLRFYKTEQDARFAENSNNRNLIVTIPITHLDYQCAKNSLEECTNQEEERSDIRWSQKRYFKPQFAALKVQEINNLPASLQAYFGCYSDVDATLAGYTIEADAVNLEVDHTLKATPGCLSQAATGSLSDATITVRHHYSFVKISSLASPAYQAVEYPKVDQNKFGFFTTEKNVLSVDYNDEVRGEKEYMNRWNPARRELPYYLSENFDKPEHAEIKLATEKAVSAINAALAEAGTDLKMTLRSGAGKRAGDIRNSMIVMVEDPQATNVIGYGPVVTDPRTGEILSARTVMYLGTIRKYVKNTWDDLIELREAENAEATRLAEIAARAPVSAPSTGPVSPSVVNPGAISSFISETGLESMSGAAGFERAIARLRSSSSSPDPRLALAGQEASGRPERSPIDALGTEGALAEAKDYTLHVKDRDLSNESWIEGASHSNIYPAELVNFTDVVANVMSDERILPIERKRWDELSDSDKKTIIAVVLPKVWVPTLVHELGHNLGLRHNFSGSEDKDNFYSAEELSAKGVSHPMLYSSIMDYAHRTLNELSMMGKYDVAALRFGYKREVELTNGQKVRVAEGRPIAEAVSDFSSRVAHQSAAARLKPYQFCTDEHVGQNPGCKRHDEGTSLTEIANHFKANYERAYKKRNFRLTRRGFSLAAEAGHFGGIDALMLDMRLFLEKHEQLVERLGANNPAWGTDPFLIQVKESMKISRQFLLDVIRTPEAMCVVREEATRKVQLLRLAGRGATRCDEIALRPGFKHEEQIGKLFASAKANTNTNPYADQIDVRGIWGDKLLAVKHLFRRRLGSSTLDRITGNYLEADAASAAEIMATVTDVLRDAFLLPNRLVNESGARVDYFYRLFASHGTPAPISSSVGRGFQALGLPSASSHFVREMLRTIVRESSENVSTPSSRELREAFGIQVAMSDGQLPPLTSATLDVGSKRYVATRGNSVALMLIDRVKAARVLNNIPKPRLAALFAIEDESQRAAAAQNDFERAALSLDGKLVEEHLRFGLIEETAAQGLEMLLEAQAQ